MSTPGAQPAVQLLRWSWKPATQAVTPQAVVALDNVVPALLARVSRQPSAQRERLTVVAAPDWLVLLGPEDDLPWVDGVRYAAPSAQAPALWLPTHHCPDLPEDLMAEALARRHGAGPLLLWSSPEAVLPLHGAQPATDAVLFTVQNRLGLRPAQAPRGSAP